MVLPFESMDYGEDEVGARNITELTDVSLTNLANGEILKYNTTSGKWENQPDSAGGGSLDALTDTNISTPSNGQFLQYNNVSSKWENINLLITDTDNLVDLTDTNISSVANNEILKYNSSSSKWENNNLLINEIHDVNITSLQNGEVLKYNTSTGKWENQDNTDTLNELTDVTLTGSSNNQVLKYNGSIWVNNFVNLTELADTNIPALNNGDILRYNSVSQKWETDTFNINDLDDVNITSVANNEVLKYNSTTNKWENSNRIDTLDELGDVALTGVTTGDLLRYNGSNFINTKIALDNDFTNVNFTSLTNGDLIKYNGSNFINFAPTYLDGAGISDNYLIKVVSGASVQTSITETNTVNTTTINLITGAGTNGSIETELFSGGTKKRMHLTTEGISSGNGITITSDGRVGIGVVEPEDDLEIGGSIQIDSGGTARLKFQHSGGSPHALAEIDAEEDGTNGGQMEIYTKVDGGSVTEKLRINNVGAIGIGGANYGTSGQILTSNGNSSPPVWTDTISCDDITVNGDASFNNNVEISGNLTILGNFQLFKPSYATFYRSSNQTLPLSTWTQVILDGTAVNSGDFSLSSGEVVVSTAGVYNINAGLYLSVNNSVAVYFYKNNTPFAMVTNETDSDKAITSGICISVSANDRLYFRCLSTGGNSTVYGDSTTYFTYISLFRVG